MCANVDDLATWEEVSELYFGAREDESDQDADDSPWDDSSSESGEDECYDDEPEIYPEPLESDLTEKAKVKTFWENTCKCKLAEGDKPCSTTLSLDDFYDSRNNCNELSSAELDLVILGAIQSSLNCNEISVSGRSEKQRKVSRMAFYYHGKRICRTSFLFLHCLSKNRLWSLVKHYRKNGLTLRVHGNKKRLPSSAFSAETVANVVKFITNIAEEQALLLPGRVPGFKRVDVKLLPSVLTKHGLWKMYTEISSSQNSSSVFCSRFRILRWLYFFPRTSKELTVRVKSLQTKNVIRNATGFFLR